MMATYDVLKKPDPNRRVHKKVDTIRLFGSREKVLTMKVPEGEFILVRQPVVTVHEG